MKTIYHILFSLLFVLAFVGCDDDDDKVIERNQLKLTASAQSVTLTPDATDDLTSSVQEKLSTPM